MTSPLSGASRLFLIHGDFAADDVFSVATEHLDDRSRARLLAPHSIYLWAFCQILRPGFGHDVSLGLTGANSSQARKINFHQAVNVCRACESGDLPPTAKQI